jgi:iron complex outermembrane receptor protein
MKITHRLVSFAVLLGSSSLLHGQATPASTNSSAPEVIILPSFSVTSQAGDRYGSTDVTSIARTSGSILDAPLTVNVIPKELMSDLGANVTYDVTRYFAGVSNGRGAGAGGIMDRQDFRGFESFSKTIDNFSSFLLPTGSGFQANFDPAFIERSELVMGPDTILSPTGSPGGSINIITKSPQYREDNSITGQVGNYGAQKAILDSTGPISQKLAYRVIGSFQDTKTYEPGSVIQTNGSVQLAYKISDTSKLTFKWFGEDWSVKGAEANPNDNGEIIYTPDTIGGETLPNTPEPGFRYDGWNGSARWSQRYDRLNIGEVEYTGTIADLVSVRLAAEELYDNFTQDVGYPNTSGPTEVFNAAGQVIGFKAGTALNPAALPEEGNWVHQLNYEEQVQNDYAANFKPGGIVSISPVVGWAYQQGSEPTNNSRGDTNAADFPATNLFATDDYDPPHPSFADYTSSYTYQPEHSYLYQAYGLLKLGFLSDRILLTGGVSRTWANATVYTTKSSATTFTNTAGQTLYVVPANTTYVATFADPQDPTGANLAGSEKSFKDNYLGGLLVKPAKYVSLYASSSTNSGISGNAPVLWQDGKQYEFGVKTQFFDQRIQISADHFQIVENNVSSVNPLHNTVQAAAANLYENETNHGYELNVIGGITRNLSVIASYTDMKLRNVAGQRLRNVPDNMANLLLNYHFTDGALKNFAIFAGVVHVGKTSGEVVGAGLAPTPTTPGGLIGQPGYYVDEWNVINAGASYTWKRYSFNLNVDNVLNSKFWWEPAGRVSVSPYPGITFRFSTTVHF